MVRVEDFIFFVDPSVETYDSLSRKFLDRLGHGWRGAVIKLIRSAVDLNATVKWSNGTWTNVDWNAASDECQWRKKTLAEYGIRSGERAFVCLSK